VDLAPDTEAEVRAELRARRAEFWMWTWRVAIGVFIGLAMFTLVMWALLDATIDLSTKI
jgi:uncharacterized membrane protein YhaH (DUF805 family)